MQEKLIELIAENPTITRQEMADIVGKSLATVKNNLSMLKKREIIKYVGSTKTGHWVIIYK